MDLQKRWAIFFTLLLVSHGTNSSPGGPKARQSEGSTKAMLDAMQQLLMGGGEYDPVYLERIFACMDTISPRLKEASDMAWNGMVEYSDQNGAPGDEWGACLGTGHCVSYFEQNATAQEYHNITIYEPCNYASNVAYYRVTVAICDRDAVTEWSMSSQSVVALAETFSHLAMGSAFWHGSHTTLGNVFDNRGIEVLAWVAYQAAIEGLPDANLPVIKDLQEEARPYTAVEINDQMTNMFLQQPVGEWTDTILGLNMPNYYMTFAAMVVTVLTLAVEDELAEDILFFLKDLFNFPEEEWDFIYNTFLPEIRNGTSEIELNVVQKLQLEENFTSTVIKMLYAFVWQEWVITDNPTLLEPEVNAKGNDLIPTVNAFANALNTFPIYDQDLQDGYNIFPGDVWCNDFNPHSKWHMEAAAGLTDLILLMDEINRLTKASNAD